MAHHISMTLRNFKRQDGSAISSTATQTPKAASMTTMVSAQPEAANESSKQKSSVFLKKVKKTNHYKPLQGNIACRPLPLGPEWVIASQDRFGTAPSRVISDLSLARHHDGLLLAPLRQPTRITVTVHLATQLDLRRSSSTASTAWSYLPIVVFFPSE
jgi:hypothetical protein